MEIKKVDLDCGRVFEVIFTDVLFVVRNVLDSTFDFLDKVDRYLGRDRESYYTRKMDKEVRNPKK